MQNNISNIQENPQQERKEISIFYKPKCNEEGLNFDFFKKRKMDITINQSAKGFFVVSLASYGP